MEGELQSRCGVCVRREAKPLAQWAVYLCIYLAIYGYASFRFGPGWDEINCYAKPVNPEYLLVGRWGLHLYRIVFGGGAVPFVAGLVAGMFLSAALVMQTYALAIRGWFPKLVYGGMYFACIQWLLQLRYCVQSDALGLAFLSLSAALLLLAAKPWWAHFLSSLLVCLALSVYQTMGLVWVALLLLYALSGLILQGRMPEKHWCVRCAIVTVCAIAVFFAVAAFAKNCVSVPQEMREALQQSVVDRYPQWIAQANGPVEMAKAFAHYSITVPLKQAILAHDLYAGHWVYTTVLIPVLLLLPGLWRRKRGAAALLGTVLLLAAPLLPYETMRVFPGRVYIAEPVIVAGMWGLFLQTETGRLRAAKAAVALLVCFACLKSMYKVALSTAEETYYFERGIEELQNMHERGRQAAMAAGLKDCPIVLMGCYDFTNEQMKAGWANHFQDSALPVLIYWGADAYTEHLRYSRMKQGFDKDMEKHADTLKGMPCWPADDSIRVDQGEVIIKLNEIPNND